MNIDPIDITAYSLILICAISYLWILQFKKLKQWGLILALTVIVQASVFYLSNHDSAFYWVYNVYTPVECFLWCQFYYTLFKRRLFRSLSLASFIAFILSQIYLLSYNGFDFIFEESFVGFAIESIVIIVLSLLFLFEVYTDMPYRKLYLELPFWIVCANFLFYSATWVGMAFFEPLNKENPADAELMMYITRFSNILLYSLYICGLALYQWKRKSSG